MTDSSPSASSILSLIAGDMRQVDAVIARRLDSGVPLVGEVSRYIISSGGKRLRPALLLLVCGALGYGGEQRFNLAAVVEFIHTATLVENPYAGRYSENLDELIAIGEELGGLLGGKCVQALGIPPGAAHSYGKGAIVGGVAGHYAGHHGLLGAAAGCAIGRHEANKRAREQAERARAQHPSGQ